MLASSFFISAKLNFLFVQVPIRAAVPSRAPMVLATSASISEDQLMAQYHPTVHCRAGKWVSSDSLRGRVDTLNLEKRRRKRGVQPVAIDDLYVEQPKRSRSSILVQ